MFGVKNLRAGDGKGALRQLFFFFAKKQKEGAGDILGGETDETGPSFLSFQPVGTEYAGAADPDTAYEAFHDEEGVSQL